MTTEWTKAYASEIDAWATEGQCKEDGDGVFYDFRPDSASGYLQQDTSGWTLHYRANLKAPNHCKIYRYIPDASNYDMREPPLHVDYGGTNLTRRLFRNRKFVKGELQAVEY